ncbi:hypothetical protein L3Y34_006164 [Caenorhabditis briggsae]|uniref:Uncharacterized protein n=1 Tax=Caenorhabditis briggsae TaxID=6238 RepID=A0AAE9CZ15_CAEBR|nr:hypothetical protein L3Y34_006164 [Caenorhabditis briggsae]
MTPTYFSLPDQEKAKLELLKIVPCPTPVYFEPNVFVLMDHQGRWFIQLQCTTFFCVLIAQVFIVILPILYCGCAIEWYWYYQSFSNTAIICVSFHGMSSTIAIFVNL